MGRVNSRGWTETAHPAVPGLIPAAVLSAVTLRLRLCLFGGPEGLGPALRIAQTKAFIFSIGSGSVRSNAASAPLFIWGTGGPGPPGGGVAGAGKAAFAANSRTRRGGSGKAAGFGAGGRLPPLY